MKKALVSVTGVDKPGIIAKVSTALYELNVNVLEISQTILDGYFTMLMIVDVTNACPLRIFPPVSIRWATNWAKRSIFSGRTFSTPCIGSEVAA